MYLCGHGQIKNKILRLLHLTIYVPHTPLTQQMESDLKPLAELLDDRLDDLTEAIDPLLSSPLSESTSRLPIVDKAKLHVLHVYALESLLFCTFHHPWIISSPC